MENNERNRTNQCNETHKPSGPGHQKAYQGDTSKANLDNHANQLNPTSKNYNPPKRN